LNKPKGTIVSKKTHIGNNRFISINASYENDYVTKIRYNVYQQYGASKQYIVSLELSKHGIRVKTDTDSHYGVNNSALKERAFSTFQSKVLCEELRNNIKTIIKGVS
jgi:hypothetical protein